MDTTPFEHDLQLGNAHAPLQIMVACNPYCGPCAKAHEQLHKLLEKNDKGLTIRFTIKHDKKDDPKTKAVEYLLRLMAGKTASYKKKVVHDWFLQMNMEQFTAAYPLKVDVDVNTQLQQHGQRADDAGIQFTPTIFINGYELPRQYNTADLAALIRRLELRTNKTVQAVENNYAPA